MEPYTFGDCLPRTEIIFDIYSLLPIVFSNEYCNFIKKETLALVFSCEFCEISKNTFSTEHLQTTASGIKRFRLIVSNAFDKSMKCASTSKVHLHIYLYQFSISSSQSCLGETVLSTVAFFRNLLVKSDNLLLMNSSICLYINLFKYFGYSTDRPY